MPANKFVLKGSHVTVEYTIGGNPSFPALTYSDGAFQRSFKPDAIATDDTGLGELVSVALVMSIDAGGERFGFFLPSIEVPSGETAHFHTIGILRNVQRTRLDSPQAIDMAVHRNEWHCAERDCAIVD
jgi:hypothetical protein